MKKLLVTLALLVATLPALAQTAVNPKPDCIIPFTFTAAGSGMVFDNRPHYDATGQFVGGCITWHLEYQNNGFTVVSIEPQGADNSGAGGSAGTFATWSPVASGTTLPLTATTYGQATGFRFQPWVKVKVNTATGTGTISGVLLGWRPLSGQDASSSTAAGGGGTGANATQVQGTTAFGSAYTDKPVVIAGVIHSTDLVARFKFNADNSPWLTSLVNFNDTAFGRNNFGVFMNSNNIGGPLVVAPVGWDGTNSPGFYVASLANFPVTTTLTARNSKGAQIVENGSRWSVTSSPAVSNVASASIAAEASVRHVVDCVSFSGGSTTAPVLTPNKVVVRDGAAGAGTIIWQHVVIVAAATGQNVPPFNECGLNLPGTTNTAMTAEWSALLTNEFEAVNISGFNVN